MKRSILAVTIAPAVVVAMALAQDDVRERHRPTPRELATRSPFDLPTTGPATQPAAHIYPEYYPREPAAGERPPFQAEGLWWNFEKGEFELRIRVRDTPDVLYCAPGSPIRGTGWRIDAVKRVPDRLVGGGMVIRIQYRRTADGKKFFEDYRDCKPPPPSFCTTQPVRES